MFLNCWTVLIFFCISLLSPTFASNFLLPKSQTSICPYTDLAWLHLAKNVHCIRFLTTNTPRCIYDYIYRMNIHVINQDFHSFLQRNVLKEMYMSDCESFLLYRPREWRVKLLFTHNTSTKRFFPFSRIFIIQIESEFSHKNHSEFNDVAIRNTILENGLDVFMVRGWKSNISGALIYSEIKNLLTEKTVDLLKTPSHRKMKLFYGEHRFHPFVDVRDPEKTFTVSLFNCSPAVIHFDESSNLR